MLFSYLCFVALHASPRRLARKLTAESELKFYHYSSDGSGDELSLSKETKEFQEERETKSTKVHIKEFEKNVSFAHHDPKVDRHVSGSVAGGRLFEQKSVIAMANHIEMILEELNVENAEDTQSHFSFIDIGANIGVYTVGLGAHFLDKMPIDIFAFEPSAETMALLSSSLRQNRLSNVYLYPYGLVDSGDVGDTASFVVDKTNKGHNHLEGDQSWSEHDGETVQIETVPLDLFTHILRDRYPAMYSSWTNALWLKMDTEGLEPTVIRGGQQSLFSGSELDPCFIKLEYHKHKKEIYELLATAGYEMVRFDWKSIDQQNQIPREEAIKKGGWDAIFAKKDASECVRQKSKRQFSNKDSTTGDAPWTQIISIIAFFPAATAGVMYLGWSNPMLVFKLCPFAAWFCNCVRPKRE